MIESVSVMVIIERIESKLDDVRDMIHMIDIKASGTALQQSNQEQEIAKLKTKVDELQTAYNKASGAWKLLTLPGILSLLYAISQILQKT